MAAPLTQLLIRETKRRLYDESFERIRICLNKLDEQQIWFRPNETSNSVGNLVLHLIGNARQWIVATLDYRPDVRQRAAEFAARGSHDRARLLAQLDELEQDLDPVLNQLTAIDLADQYSVQGFTEHGISILVHVIEHFSYHVGQITYITKMLTDSETGYYAGHTLD